MTNDNEKVKAFFILHDPDVVEQKVVEVFGKLFNNTTGNKHAQQNAQGLLYTLMIADANENHPTMNRVMNELFHSGRMYMQGDFIDRVRQLIRGVVQEEISRVMNQLERQTTDLKRAEYNKRYNKF